MLRASDVAGSRRSFLAPNAGSGRAGGPADAIEDRHSVHAHVDRVEHG